ncbi:type IX secretion system outer membrane channel protein PorV [Mesonia aestuariivivens]|uniref:Type IX secretion system outer membrane channel protein PorV n=1 Tax=Mesonia aestuariivivens TaxID=2796128 RepID=A0ABS6W5E8_9FLAO|nr:type IX secretion system outer membrane channel protein PorV [Mesonia aestuariivivens]MBW2962711.1 type IX secretion system outer membrane channel protein PorV [Mesonia aestuariivivens]
MKNTFLLLLGVTFISMNMYAQSENPPSHRPSDRVITTAVPFLLISGDARASGMGDQGVATSPDAFSQQWNPSKFAFAEMKNGIGFSYVPYLRELVNDINIAQLSYFNRISERSAVAGSFRYFSQGEVELRNSAQDVGRTVKPNELALDLTYALRLSERFSMAVTGRYIRSDLRIPTDNVDASSANSFAADVSAFYQSEEIPYRDFNGRWRAGVNISNIGPKIKYDDAGSENFLPTNFKAGAGFDFILDPDNTIGVYAEINKLLVPTPKKPNYQDLDGDGLYSQDEINVAENEAIEDYQSESAIGSIFSSWGDAPDGMSEELKEITWALGAEYWYRESFALRLGYFNESEVKGFRKFLSLGAGFRYNAIDIDASYLFSTAKAVQSPLEGSLRFSLTFNFGDTYNER